MKEFVKNGIIKKFLIVLITITIISNFIMPNTVHADNDKAIENIADGFFYLLAKLGDVCISTMQEIMLGTGYIGGENVGYSIKYSPGKIFANKVPALDINFIKPMDDYTIETNNQYITSSAIIKSGLLDEIMGINPFEKPFSKTIRTDWKFSRLFGNEKDEKIKEYLIDCGYYSPYSYSISIGNDKFKEFLQKHDTLDNYTYLWVNNESLYKLKINIGSTIPIDFLSLGFVERDKIEFELYKYNLTEEQVKNLLTEDNIKKSDKTEPIKKIKSTAGNLREGISKWYNALRTIALVGLLSVLVYVGIQIILSSTSSQKQAKYKEMLKDWLVALCILFVLHYIMAFMLNITDNLTGIIEDNVIRQETNSEDEYDILKSEDILFSSIRNKIGGNLLEAVKNENSTGYIIMYLALVILTGVFTFQYLKRVVFMAFLTMMAPMIALTYPLDKIKDGKAQAFNYWLKEYIFNCLLQPVHLLIYAVLLGSVIDFAAENVLYGIVALAFMVPAEKFIKEMFGMKSSSPSGALNAAAGGAVVMSMINKMNKVKPPKEEAEGGGNAPSGVRTANNYPSTSPLPQPNSTQPNPTQPNPTQPNPPQPNPPQPNPPQPNPTQPTPPQPNQPQQNPPQPNQTYTPTDHQTPNTTPQTNYNFGRGLNAVGKKYLYGPDKIKSYGKKFTRAVGGTALGALSAGAALAANVADGDLFNDPKKALGEIAGTAAVGYGAGSNLAGKGLQGGKNIGETYKEGYYGSEEYNNMKYDSKFFKSDGYKQIEQDPDIQSAWTGKGDIKTIAQSYLSNGVTDTNAIKEGMKAGVNGDDYKTISLLGVTDPRQFAAVRAKNSHKNLNAAQIAARMQIAKNLPPKLYGDEAGFVRFAKRYGIDNEDDAKRLFREIDDFT